MKASDYIIEYLISNNIDKIFGYIGGAIAHIVDSISKNSKIEMINCIHEQGAGFAAEGWARKSGLTSVVTATSGPGATNLITPIGSCFFDSVPLLVLTGQVNTYEYKFDKTVRQIGFQETDIVSIVRPITKYAVLVTEAENLRYELEKCIFISQHGRKGPVLLDVPMNIQRSEIEFKNMKSFFDSEEYRNLIASGDIKEKELLILKEIFQSCNRPCVLAGGGVRLSESSEGLRSFLSKNRLPVVKSLMGIDSVSSDYDLDCGLIGSYGNRGSNIILANADLLIVLGSRLDTRQTGTDLSLFGKKTRIIHVDIDKNELNSKISADLTINVDIRCFLDFLRDFDFSVNEKWLEYIKYVRSRFSSTKRIDGTTKIPNIIIKKISDLCYEDDVICVDVGQHQMWVAQTWNVRKNQRVFFSGGMGAMGFSLPVSIGSYIASGKRSVVITGDGGMQMNIQELEVIRRRNIPIKIIILNNKNLGMVRQFQEIYFEENYASTVYDYSVPDFESIGQSYGIKSSKLEFDKDFDFKLEKFMSSDEAELINIILPEEYTDVEPKLIVNHPIEDMFPHLSSDELENLKFENWNT